MKETKIKLEVVKGQLSSQRRVMIVKKKRLSRLLGGIFNNDENVPHRLPITEKVKHEISLYKA